MLSGIRSTTPPTLFSSAIMAFNRRLKSSWASTPTMVVHRFEGARRLIAPVGTGLVPLVVGVVPLVGVVVFVLLVMGLVTLVGTVELVMIGVVVFVRFVLGFVLLIVEFV